MNRRANSENCGFQSLADGAAKIQLSHVTAGVTLGRQLPVDLSGYGLNQLDCFGDFRVLELGNVPVENADLRVHLLPAHPGVFHEHLLLHNRP